VVKKMAPRITFNNFGVSVFGLIWVLFVGLVACDAEKEKDAGLTCGTLAPLKTGLRTVQVEGQARQFYVRVPNNVTDAERLPMVVAFHGTGGGPEYFIDDEYYDLESTVGDAALLVYPDGVPGTDGLPNWIREVTPLLFDEIVSDLEGCFDSQRLFVTGHSSGGGAAHDLGCLRGDLIRAAAPVSGILLADKDNCIGEVAVMSMHGEEDDLVPIGGGVPSKNFWVARNGCDPDDFADGENCIMYNGCDAEFPVSWCAHDEPKEGRSGQAHDWPSFASETIWDFFKSLTPLAPSDVSPDRDASPGDGAVTARFTMHFPADFSGTPDKAAASFYEAGSTQPLMAAPLKLLNMEFDVGDWAPGASVDYEIPFDMADVEPGDYTFAVVVYMVGATYPIPLPEFDYLGLAEITVVGSEEEFIFDEPIELELMAAPPAP
jgi:polyhydroxybutyrate depolymerase